MDNFNESINYFKENKNSPLAQYNLLSDAKSFLKSGKTLVNNSKKLIKNVKSSPVATSLTQFEGNLDKLSQAINKIEGTASSIEIDAAIELNKTLITEFDGFIKDSSANKINLSVRDEATIRESFLNNITDITQGLSQVLSSVLGDDSTHISQNAMSMTTSLDHFENNLQTLLNAKTIPEDKAIKKDNLQLLESFKNILQFIKVHLIRYLRSK